ncbi:membrane protein [Cryobacterium sp. MLB-32]|uniref:PLDc N-terminal domain-containing protein n=1 Tax=Cryobacterium sp. MLB-32 TaxID=1529318 RepID=UPI0004E656CA|nr:PLDc N-terminal domain-containing protein [Cryobacterium sp. MLB-32]KFF61098.1 membrane protein [Cryobacterium sp. MLB-32]
MKKAQSFSDLDPLHKTATIVAAVVQLTLAAAAWKDLARRPAASVRGRKLIWAGVIAVNFVGPLSYFRWGRLPR